jgi:hypothetical protein
MSFNKKYELFGFIQGDGDLGRLKSQYHKGIEINIGANDGDIYTYFELSGLKNRTVYYNENNILNELRSLRFDSRNLPNREFPKTFDNWSDDNKTSFIRGLYSANGSFIKVGRISFKSTSIELINKLKDELMLLGFNPYVTTNKAKLNKFHNGEYLCRESYDLNIGRQLEVLRFYNEIGFIQNYKMKNIHEYLKSKLLTY